MSVCTSGKFEGVDIRFITDLDLAVQYRLVDGSERSMITHEQHQRRLRAKAELAANPRRKKRPRWSDL